jgi:cobalt-precorrin 5A hydrolase
MKTAILSITAGGAALADRLGKVLEGCVHLSRGDREAKVSQLLENNWNCYDAFICIMAAGIAVRGIAPLLRDKTADPAVLVMDEKGHFVISLVSGHIGGANQLARTVAEKVGATPVITTSSDTLELVALDLWARDQQLTPPARTELTAVSAKLVNTGSLWLFTDEEVASLPPGILRTPRLDEADIVVSARIIPDPGCSFFRPKKLVVGVGCNRGTCASEFEDALTELFQELALDRGAIRNLASVDKKSDEAGLLEFAEKNRWGIDFHTSSEINTLHNLEISFAALKAIGAIGVAEPAALLSAESNLLLCRKRKWKNVTMAVAQAPFMLSAQVLDPLT